MRRETRGTETSKYPKEKKTKVIAKVAASEMALVQTKCYGIWGCGTSTKRFSESSRSVLEKHTTEGESPVGERGVRSETSPEYHGARRTLWEAGRTISQD